MTINSIEQLKTFLVEDQRRASLNPVRFINVESMRIWVEAKKMILTISDKSLFLSDFCESPDSTPNINRAMSKFKNETRTVLVAPLSEYLRVKPELASSTISRILTADYNNNDDGKLRLYFLMYRMKDILRNVPNNDPRRNNSIVYLNTCEEPDYSLTIIQKELEVHLPGNEVFGFKSYLQYWEQNPDMPLILHTKNAIYFEENNFFDDVKVIVNSFDLLSHSCKLPRCYVKEFGSPLFWDNLAKVAVAKGDFDAACKEILKTNKYTVELFERWNTYDDFRQWLLWLWTKIQDKDSYITASANNSVSIDEFIEALYLDIIRHLHKSTYYAAYASRKKVLLDMKLSAVPLKFRDKLNDLCKIDTLLCLTSNTETEKKAIFDILQEISYSNKEDYFDALKIVYPDLANYLQCDEVNPSKMPSELYSYFQEYKWLKATNNLTRSFYDIVQNYAKAKGEKVFSLPTRREIIDGLYDDETAILFVDGLGVEYIDFLYAQFKNLSDKEYDIIYNVGSAHLPTVTDINKDFLLNRNVLQPIYQLDELKHSSCTYPISIIKELYELNKILDIVLNAFSNSIKRVIIAADHGTSRLAVLVRDTEFDFKVKPGEREIYRYGRYCKGTDLETELDTAISYDGKLIFADYSRFEQKGAPTNEIHGGASLEEWVVPIISIEKIDKSYTSKAIAFDIRTPVVTPEIGSGKVTIRFAISEQGERKLSVSIIGKKIACRYDSGSYIFDYVPNKNETEIQVSVMDRRIIGKFSVEIKQKISHNKKFDI